jgi:hypothetical protein
MSTNDNIKNNFDNVDLDDLVKLLNFDKISSPQSENGEFMRQSPKDQRPQLVPIQPRPAFFKSEATPPKPNKKPSPSSSKKRQHHNVRKSLLMPSITIPRNLDQFKTELRNRILARQVRLGKLPASYFELNPYYNGTDALQTYWNTTDTSFASSEFYGDVMVRGGEEVWLNLNCKNENEELDGQFLESNLFGATSFEMQQPIAYAFGDDPYINTPFYSLY